MIKNLYCCFSIKIQYSKGSLKRRLRSAWGSFQIMLIEVLKISEKWYVLILSTGGRLNSYKNFGWYSIQLRCLCVCVCVCVCVCGGVGVEGWVKTLKNIKNHSLKLAKVFIIGFYSNTSQYSGAIKACKKFVCPVRSRMNELRENSWQNFFFR